MTYGEVVAYYLEQLGISQSELARRMGTGRQTLNSIIRDNRRGPRLDTAISVANALGVPLQDMVDKMKEDLGDHPQGKANEPQNSRGE